MEGLGGPAALFWVKKKSPKEEKPAARAKKRKKLAKKADPSLVQGLLIS